MEQSGTVYSVGEYISCQGIGICQISDISEMDFGDYNPRKYYKLRPVYDVHSTSYLPVDSPEVSNKLRKLITKDEIDTVIDDAERVSMDWIENGKQRAERFNAILSDGDRVKALWLVKTLSMHKAEVESQNRKFYASDARILAAAEKLVCEEFAFVLGCDKNEVIPYIKAHLKGVEQTPEMQAQKADMQTVMPEQKQQAAELAARASE